MIIKEIEIERFRAIENEKFKIGKRLTAIVGRNASMKTTLLGMLGQPFSIGKESVLYGEKTLDGYDYRSQLKEKFKLSQKHDIAGEHIWTLYFRNKIYNNKDYIKIKSTLRKSKGKEDTIRFINAEQGKTKGHGYVQIPVFYLSLTRLFPIGESGKTKSISLNLTSEEKGLYIKWYKEILSIQSMNNPNVALEKKDAKRIFSGIEDDSHDIDTISAGEGNIGRIIVAVLSFRRLKNMYSNDYIGGILLIDEIDATLHGFSQRKIVEFLSEQSCELNLQVIFTTHSPNILKAVNEIQRNEVKQRRIKDVSKYEFDNQIIHLETRYDDKGKRLIYGNNIINSVQLRKALNDMEMKSTFISQHIHLYTEDEKSADLLKKIFEFKGIDLLKYVDYIDVNLGWTNYCHLITKKIPEFLSSIIVLDKDVENKDKNEEQKMAIELNNVLFMPVDVERGMFSFLKQHNMFNKFHEILYANNCELSYDICFNEWTEIEYDTNELKRWFKHLENSIGNLNLLYEFWCKENNIEVDNFVELFKTGYNTIAQNEGLDYMI